MCIGSGKGSRWRWNGCDGLAVGRCSQAHCGDSSPGRRPTTRPAVGFANKEIASGATFSSLGSENSDFLQGTTFADSIRGGDGDDTLLGWGVGDDIKADAGDDEIVWTNGDGRDLVNGGSG